MAESNYQILRERMGLEYWEEDWDGGGGMVTHAPTNKQILTLLDALHADMKGERLREVREIETERWWNS